MQIQHVNIRIISSKLPFFLIYLFEEFTHNSMVDKKTSPTIEIYMREAENKMKITEIDVNLTHRNMHAAMLIRKSKNTYNCWMVENAS